MHLGSTLSANLVRRNDARLAFFTCLVVLGGCKTAPDSLDPVALGPSASAAAQPAVPSARKLDVLASCRATGTAKGVTWQCPNDVVALDMQSDKHDDTAEVAQNLDKFAEPFVGMGIPRDNGELVAGSARLRSVKLAGEKPGAGPVVARMAIVDSTPTRYVSCAASETPVTTYSVRSSRGRLAQRPEARER